MKIRAASKNRGEQDKPRWRESSTSAVWEVLEKDLSATVGQ
jgi:hypothetical protein